MAIAFVNSRIQITGAETLANLRTFLTANPTYGSWSGNVVNLLNSLYLVSGASLTSLPNTVWDFRVSARFDSLDGTCTYDWSTDNTIIFSGNAKGHSWNLAKNIYSQLKFIIQTASGRNDFSTPSCVWQGTDLSFIPAHSGDTFLHLEDTTGLSNFQGATRILNQKTGGTYYVQFDSNVAGNKTYAGFQLPSGITFFAPRLNGFGAICEDFTFAGSGNLETRAGDNTNGFLVPRNPIFTGATDNLRPFSRTTSGYTAEQFSFSAKNLIKATPLKTLVRKVSDSSIVFNNNFSAANLTTYKGESVLWLETRRATTALAASTRSTFNFLFRRKDIVDIAIAGQVFNAGVSTSQDITTDPYYTTDQSANLSQITFTVVANAITNMAINTNMTLDKAWDITKAYFEANMQTVNPFSANGTDWNLGAVSITNAQRLETGEKLKSMRTTGTITDSGASTITGTAPTFTDSNGTRLALTNRNGVLMSSYVLINGVAVGGNVQTPGFIPLVNSRTLTVKTTDVVRIVVGAYGYKNQVINCTGAELDKFTVSLEADPGIDTTVSTTTRDAITAITGFVQATPTVVHLTFNQTLASYLPAECVSGISYAFASKGFLAYAGMAQANTASLFKVGGGELVVYSPNFKVRMSDLNASGQPIDHVDVAYSIPLVMYYLDTTTNTQYPLTKLNATGACIATAPWTKLSADITNADKDDIVARVEASTILAKEVTIGKRPTVEQIWTFHTRTITSGGGGVTLEEIEASTILAKEATVQSRASQSSVNTIPTNPLLDTDTRLNNIDVAISTRLATMGYTAPANADIASIKAKTDTLVNTDISTLAKEATLNSSVMSIKGADNKDITQVFNNTPTIDNAGVATAVRTELTPELLRIDTAISSRMATFTYIAPDNQTISAIQTKVNSQPTLSEIEGSTVISKASKAITLPQFIALQNP